MRQLAVIYFFISFLGNGGGIYYNLMSESSQRSLTPADKSIA